MKRTLIALALLALPAAASAQQNWVKGTPYLVVETGQRYNRLQDALFAIGNGKGTIRIASGRWDDCGVQIAGDVTFQAEVPGKVLFQGPRVCETKAALVLRGRNARVEGIVFAEMRTNDGNGAGIRLESGNLTVSQSWFHDSDNGILGANDPKGSVTIDHSTFTRLGRCDRGLSCAHSIYIGFYGSVTVTNTRFEAGAGGHYLKSRAARITATDDAFDDSKGHGTNYLIDLPAGATGTIAHNLMIWGPSKENPTTLIAVNAEGHEHSSNGLTIDGNVVRMAPGAPQGAAFVGDWAGDGIRIGANTLPGGIQRYVRR
jgi:hypothetical protein